MKNLIRKILKEEEDDVFNWADDIINPPSQILDNLELNTEWVAYIPEISKEISFNVNPESWQPMASIRVNKVESRGHGSFGDNPHKDYQPSVLDNLGFGRSNWGPSNHEPIGEDGSEPLYDVMDVVKDIKGYSEEAKQLTLEYRQRIQELTNQYAENLKSLHSKYNFDNEGWGNSVTVASLDSQGQVWTDDKWDKTHGGGEFRKYPGHKEVREKKYRNFPPKI
jgi:hypothetical protein